ncbi:transposase family protein [Streptomyces sp. NPDC088350]|uniref:helix-turn-helix domain-containing protein n=1 Tax=Streptomyces sp. NPDC088350 TaxID=3365854 RepID=UPI0037FE3BAA
MATLVHLRHGATHDVPACWFGVDRSTIPRAIGDIRPLFCGPDEPVNRADITHPAAPAPTTTPAGAANAAASDTDKATAPRRVAPY